MGEFRSSLAGEVSFSSPMSPLSPGAAPGHKAIGFIASAFLTGVRDSMVPSFEIGAAPASIGPIPFNKRKLEITRHNLIIPTSSPGVFASSVTACWGPAVNRSGNLCSKVKWSKPNLTESCFRSRPCADLKVFFHHLVVAFNSCFVFRILEHLLEQSPPALGEFGLI